MSTFNYFRLNVTANNGDSLLEIAELYFYDSKENDFAPHNMNSYEDSNYKVSTSSEYLPEDLFHPWKVFDGKYVGILTYYVANTNAAWLQIQFKNGNSKEIKSYGIRVNTIPEPARAPKNWTFEGSNDGINWTILDTRVGETNWLTGELRIYTLPVPSFYGVVVNQRLSPYKAGTSDKIQLKYNLYSDDKTRLSYIKNAALELKLNTNSGLFQVVGSGTTDNYGTHTFYHSCSGISGISNCLGYVTTTINDKVYDSNIVRFNFA